MEHQSAKRVLRLSKELCDVFEERPVDMDLVLPDYLPEVTAVLKCSMRPVVTARHQSGDRYTVSGTVTVRLLYLTEERTEIYCYEASQPFTVSFAADQAVHHLVSVKTDYVNARAVSPRRVDVHGAFRVYLKAIGIGEQTVCAVSDERDCFCRTKTIGVTVPCCETEKAFVIEERLDIGSEVERIVCTEAVVLSTEVKPLVNKVIVKGVLQVKTLSVANRHCATQYHEIPFSQIVDVEGLNDKRQCRVEICVGEYETRLHAEESGTSCYFDGKLYAIVRCSETTEEEVVLDVYSVNAPLMCETSSISFTFNGEETSGRRDLRSVVDRPEGVSEIVDVFGEVKSLRYDDGMFYACLVIGLIGRDEHGMLGYFERTLDLQEPCETKGTLQLLRVEASKQGDELRLQLAVSIVCAEDQRELLTVVCDTIAEHQTPYVKSGASLRIVYAQVGENVWDIAKKHHACVQDILAENDLTDLTITVPTMLMIPML